MKIALAISGGLGGDLFRFLLPKVQIEAVLTDRKSEEIIQLASENKLPLFQGNPRGGKASSLIAERNVELLLSINYLFIMEQDLMNWPKSGAVNFHGSLLPKYRGRTPHVWAIINNEKKTGVTAHFISEGCDEGDIILQREISIEEEDTGADLLKKFRSIYPEMVCEVLSFFETNNVARIKQDESKASFFGKRTPDDGKINWDWQRERIQSWVRAQAYPYPGAFTEIDGFKIVIDRVVFDDYGFKESDENGKVLSVNPYRVKTPNGVLQLTNIRRGTEFLTPNRILK